MKKLLILLATIGLTGCASTYQFRYSDNAGAYAHFNCAGDAYIYLDKTTGHIDYGCGK